MEKVEKIIVVPWKVFGRFSNPGMLAMLAFAHFETFSVDKIHMMSVEIETEDGKARIEQVPNRRNRFMITDQTEDEKIFKAIESQLENLMEVLKQAKEDNSD